MDVPVGPWVALGAVLGALLVLATGATVRHLRSRTTGRPATPPPAGEPRDDLADFLAHPPGTRGEPAEGYGDGCVPLAPPAPPIRHEEPAPAPAAGALAGLAVGALLLVGIAAALAAAQRSPAPAPDEPAGAPSRPGAAASSRSAEGVVARLAFDGVVLEEHAVGITVAYPELELTVDDEGRERARLRLPAVNCLAVSAPPEPDDPACHAAGTAHAELAVPALRVDRDGDRLAVAGRFTTSPRSPGGPAEPTGRSYEVSVTVTAAGEERAGWRPVQGELRWEDQRAGTRAGGPPSVLRAGG